MTTLPPITVGNLPQQVNLQLYEGDDFNMTLTVTDNNGLSIDLTGGTAGAQVRINTDDATILASFDTSVAENVISLHLAGADTTSLPLKTVWDCEIVAPDGTITTLVAGSINMTSEVTRPSP